MKASEIRELTADELERKLAETRQELFNLRFQHATGALDNTAELTRVKRDIAQILDSPYENDRVTVPVGPATADGKPFLGSNFQTTLRDLEARMRKAAGDLEFEEAARLRDGISLPADIWEDLRRTATGLGVPVPAV